MTGEERRRKAFKRWLKANPEGGTEEAWLDGWRTREIHKAVCCTLHETTLVKIAAMIRDCFEANGKPGAK